MRRIRRTISKQECIGILITVFSLSQPLHADYYFTTPKNCGPAINTASYGESSATISADGLTLLFADQRNAPFRPEGLGEGDIWMTTRPSLEGEWSAPVNLGEVINGPALDGTPFISEDGLSLYFASERSGGFGDTDLYVSARVSIGASWEEPTNLGPQVNGASIDAFPCVSPDGLTLYFISFRSGNGDIFMATRTDVGESFGPAHNIGLPINSTDALESTPWVSPNGKVLIYTKSWANSWDLFISRRSSVNESWRTPVNLGPPVSIPNPGDESGASFTADGTRFFFFGDHTGGYGYMDLWEAEVVPVVDLNGDGRVDGGDLSVVAERWHTSDPLCDIGPTPLGDGLVDEQDLLVLAEYLEPGFGRIAHWKLDEIEGEIAFDSVGPYHADIMGEALWQSDAGTLDGALQLDGTDDYIAPALVLDPQDGPFRMTAWIQGGTPGQIIASQLPEGDTNTEFLYLAVDPDDGTLMTNMVLPNMPLDSGIVITDGQWHDVGFEWDGDYRHLYVDGTEVKDEITLPAFAFDQSGWLDIGKGKQGQPDTFWSGLIDEVKVFKKGTKP